MTMGSLNREMVTEQQSIVSSGSINGLKMKYKLCIMAQISHGLLISRCIKQSGRLELKFGETGTFVIVQNDIRIVFYQIKEFLFLIFSLILVTSFSNSRVI